MMQAARLKQVNLEIEDTSQPSTAVATITNGDEESKDVTQTEATDASSGLP